NDQAKNDELRFATGGGCNCQDIVEAHDDVGDGDDLDGFPDVGARFDALLVGLLAHEQLDGDPEQDHAANQFEPGQIEQLLNHQREGDAQEHRGSGTEDDANDALTPRQRAAGERNHNRIVAGEN